MVVAIKVCGFRATVVLANLPPPAAPLYLRNKHLERLRFRVRQTTVFPRRRTCQMCFLLLRVSFRHTGSKLVLLSENKFGPHTFLRADEVHTLPPPPPILVRTPGAQHGCTTPQNACRADPYAGEKGPGHVSRLSRVRMDLWGYGTGSTKDAYGTEADVRNISEG